MKFEKGARYRCTVEGDDNCEAFSQEFVVLVAKKNEILAVIDLNESFEDNKWLIPFSKKSNKYLLNSEYHNNPEYKDDVDYIDESIVVYDVDIDGKVHTCLGYEILNIEKIDNYLDI